MATGPIGRGAVSAEIEIQRVPVPAGFRRRVLAEVAQPGEFEDDEAGIGFELTAAKLADNHPADIAVRLDQRGIGYVDVELMRRLPGKLATARAENRLDLADHFSRRKVPLRPDRSGQAGKLDLA